MCNLTECNSFLRECAKYIKKKSVKKLYVFHHYFYGCENPKELYVYDESEIKSSKLQRYIKNHKYKGYKIDVYRFELKKWDAEDVIQLEESNGWSPEYLFAKNGFTFEVAIDLIYLFDQVKKEKSISENGKIYYFRKLSDLNVRTPHNLAERKEAIQKVLANVDNKHKNLIIFRTTRRSLYTYWDDIVIYSEGKQSLKFFYRIKINFKFIKIKINYYSKKLHELKNIRRMD